ncbi:MAG: hypothetical protein ACE5I5_02855, partial [Candidatus Heimdallarchaeota archaeon]
LWLFGTIRMRKLLCPGSGTNGGVPDMTSTLFDLSKTNFYLMAVFASLRFIFFLLHLSLQRDRILGLINT